MVLWKKCFHTWCSCRFLIHSFSHSCCASRIFDAQPSERAVRRSAARWVWRLICFTVAWAVPHRGNQWKLWVRQNSANLRNPKPSSNRKIYKEVHMLSPSTWHLQNQGESYSHALRQARCMDSNFRTTKNTAGSSVKKTHHLRHVWGDYYNFKVKIFSHPTSLGHFWVVPSWFDWKKPSMPWVEGIQ